MIKNLRIDIDQSSWPSFSAIPSSLIYASGVQSYSIDLLGPLLNIGIYTRPPASYGFTLSDCWAWLRYFPAFASQAQLKLRQEWSSIDPHQKTVSSDEFGVGFSLWILQDILGFSAYADVGYVVSTLAPNLFRMGPSTSRGSRKSPDYIALGPARDLSVIECKGSQYSFRALKDAVRRGIPQKSNIRIQGRNAFTHSLVSGIFIPQWENNENATLLICDPEPTDIKAVLLQFPRKEVGRATLQAALAVELAMLEMTNTSATLTQAKGARENLNKSISEDLDPDRVRRPRASAEFIEIDHDHFWSEPVLINNAPFSGIRFSARVKRSSIEELRSLNEPIVVGEKEWDSLSDKAYSRHVEEVKIILVSRFGTTFSLSLLEK